MENYPYYEFNFYNKLEDKRESINDVRIISIEEYNIYIPVELKDVEKTKNFLIQNFGHLKKKVRVLSEQDLFKKYKGNVLLKFNQMIAGLKICSLEKGHKKIWWNTAG